MNWKLSQRLKQIQLQIFQLSTVSRFLLISIDCAVFNIEKRAANRDKKTLKQSIYFLNFLCTEECMWTSQSLNTVSRIRAVNS